MIILTNKMFQYFHQQYMAELYIPSEVQPRLPRIPKILNLMYSTCVPLLELGAHKICLFLLLKLNELFDLKRDSYL